MESRERQLDQEKINVVADEIIKTAAENELTMLELDQAVYKVRQYFSENAVLKIKTQE
jgi:hypothetical protein|nr:MAG TPA: hypothetical protein [Caudoviricetes sp.]